MKRLIFFMIATKRIWPRMTVHRFIFTMKVLFDGVKTIEYPTTERCLWLFGFGWVVLGDWSRGIGRLEVLVEVEEFAA